MSKCKATVRRLGARLRFRIAGLAFATFLAGATSGCADEPTMVVGPERSVLELAAPPPGEPLTRDSVPFDHGKHTTALEREGCASCHLERSGGKLALGVVGLAADADRDAWMDGYHALCLGCHATREAEGAASGPLGCGDCHRPSTAPSGERARVRFDYSLHGRHAAIPDTECGGCHHVPDAQTGALVAKPGTESACRDCHGQRDDGKRLSWRHAAHLSCVQCHGEQASKKAPSGPVECAGCHDAERFAAVKRLEEAPRLERGQPDRLWVAAAGERSRAVPFDHRAHEPAASFCSGCHHHGLEKCSECHTEGGAPKGGWVTLAAAQHDEGSRHGCVGCHAAETHRPACAGCHGALAPAPQPAACQRCHEGADETAQLSEPPAPREMPQAAILPPVGPGFPESVTIDLPGEYGPSPFPHAQIVGDMLKRTGQSGLAAWFHAEPGTLCAGCHHHSPVGAAPPPCRSCHGTEQRGSSDAPGLKAAYHRQCIGCHERMAIGHVGCTDCHQALTEEKAR